RARRCPHQARGGRAAGAQPARQRRLGRVQQWAGSDDAGRGRIVAHAHASLPLARVGGARPRDRALHPIRRLRRLAAERCLDPRRQRDVVPRASRNVVRCRATDGVVMKILVKTITFALAVATLAALGTGASATVLASASTRPSITVRVDDRRILAPTRMPAGYVDIHIVTSGNVHHNLAFWHLHRGDTAKRFIQVLKGPNGDPFKLGTAIGGNGPMLAGHLDATMRLVPGRVVFADIVEGPTTRITSFEVVGAPV